MNNKQFPSISIIAFAVTSTAFAQTATEHSASEVALEEVVVTGSRIARTEEVSTSPIVSYGEEAITTSGQVNIEATLNQLPQFVQAQGQSTVGAVAQAGRATLNLRGLGETRNLVLLDGRRLPLSNAFAAVDVNLIPQSILEGVDVITGGASAVYGSDAMSGVVNFRTRRDFEGLEFNGRYGISDRGDAESNDASITAGFTFGNEQRGKVLLSFGYTDRDKLFGRERDFYQLGVLSSFIAQGSYVPSATNLPDQTVVNNVFAGYGIAPGTVLNSRTLGVNDDMSLFQQIGATNYKGPTTGYFSTVGGTVRQPVTYQEYVVNPMKRRSFFAKFDYELADNLDAYGQFLYNKTYTEGQVGWSPTLFVVPVVPMSNPFIPADLRAILNSRPTPGATFTLNQRFMGFEDRKFPADFSVGQYILGLRGALPFKDWKWDVYGSFDQMDLVETQDEALLLSRMSTLLNAADGGASICAGGFNPFSFAASTNVSPACINYISANTHDFSKTKQHILEGNLTGGLFPTPAGETKFSLTLNYRDNYYDFNPDPARENGDIIGTLPTAPSKGDINVTEAALELLVPLLKDAPFAQALDLNLGVRSSDYDVSGRSTTYKADAVWKPVRELIFRGGFERAIRAPNIGELYSAASSAQAQIGSPPGQGDPCDVRSAARSGANAAALRALCLSTGVPAPIVDTFQYTTVAVGTVISGSTALEPEEADTITFGGEFRLEGDSPLLSALKMSIDYYNIKIDKVINVVSGVTAMNKCYNLDGSNPGYSSADVYCRLITRDGTGGIRTVATPYLNLGGLKTSGIDMVFDWIIPAGSSASTLELNLLANYTQSYEVQLITGSPWQEFSGTIDGTANTGIALPEWKLLTTLTYRLGDFETGLRWKHLPAMKDVTSVTRPASPAPGVDAYDLFDLNAAYRFNKMFLLRAGVVNLADKDPPRVAGTVGLTQPGTYDIIGRSFYAQLQANF